MKKNLALNNRSDLSLATASDCLAALAHPSRLAAFRLLVQAGALGLSAGDLAAKLDIAPSALTFHLKDLSHASLVVSSAHGRQVIYRAQFAQMNALVGFLTENCCEGKAC